MTSDTDSEATLRKLIDCFRNRLNRLIQVEPVLDHISFIEREQKDLILNKARTENSQRAANLLIDIVIKDSLPPGRCREFVDALKAGGCTHAAQYVDPDDLPSPSLEANNDYIVKLFDLLAPCLVKMKTDDVCLCCYAKGILTDEDRDTILAEGGNHGAIGGARLLLRRVVVKPPGWFSTFLEVLKETEHFDLIQELTGGPTMDGNEAGEAQDVAPEKITQLATTLEGMDLYCADSEKTEDRKVPAEAPEPDATKTEDHGNSEDAAEPDAEKTEKNGSPSESPEPGCIDEGAAAEDLQDTDIVLRDYQMEVAKPALEGENIIICLPTGSGKTRAAVYITKHHLDSRVRERQAGKVVVLVNKVPLVEQHYSKEFGKFLKPYYKVERVSGNSQLKISFPEVVKKNDIIICTAQILENSFQNAKSEDDEGVRLSDFSLMVIDECHHTQKGEAYNHVMIRYLKQKFRNQQLKKEQKEPLPIPQILGLTASPGVDGARKSQKAEEHILKICANLDARKIMPLAGQVRNMKGPYKSIAIAAERKELSSQLSYLLCRNGMGSIVHLCSLLGSLEEWLSEDSGLDTAYRTLNFANFRLDPFGDVIKGIMNEIHEHATLFPTCDLGTQNYEQWTVQTEQKAAKEENQKVRVCAEHLRQYNEALYQNNTIRMTDAFSFLCKFHDEEIKKKVAPEETEAIDRTETEVFLFNLFKVKKKELQIWASKPEFENKVLSTLRTTILQQFTSRTQARGIIFTKTRRSAIALQQWIEENRKFEEVGVKASHLIGGGDQSVVKPMTSKEQKDVLTKFHTGEINLLIATTVAEEGLDIKECNFVIRYGLVTNEIAMIQARGRGRAEDSCYILVAEEGTGVAEREGVNEFREKMMARAIKKVQSLDQKVYEDKIKESQMQAIVENRVRKKKMKQKVMKTEDPSRVKFSCRNCFKHVCTGENIEKIDEHYVNVTDEFKELFIVRENMVLQERQLDYDTNGTIACKGCGHTWGSMMVYRGIDCPSPHIRNFLVTYKDKQKTFDKWNELSIRFPIFDYCQHADLLADNSEDDSD